MYYFEEGTNLIKKYKVSYSKEELLLLRKEIIDNCSEIIHKDYETTTGPSSNDPLKIRNLVRCQIGVKEYRMNTLMPDRKLYRYIYDEYNFPYLVSLIDRLINGDVSALKEIFNINYDKELKPFQDKVDKASSELDSIDNLRVREKRAKLDELQRYLEQLEYNKKQVSVIPYYQKVIDYLNLELVDTISRDSVTRVNSFFNRDDSILHLILSKK